MEWDIDGDGSVDTVNYCYGGKPVMDLYPMTNALPRRSMNYYDANGSVRLLVGDRSGVGTFTDRVFYEDGGARREWWYENRWSDGWGDFGKGVGYDSRF